MRHSSCFFKSSNTNRIPARKYAERFRPCRTIENLTSELLLPGLELLVTRTRRHQPEISSLVGVSGCDSASVT